MGIIYVKFGASPIIFIYTDKIFKIAIKEAYENIRTMVINLSYRAYTMSLDYRKLFLSKFIGKVK